MELVIIGYGNTTDTGFNLVVFVNRIDVNSSSNENSNINDVIRAVLNFLNFFYEKISHSHKARKAPKALKGTKTLRQKHKMQISE